MKIKKLFSVIVLLTFVGNAFAQNVLREFFETISYERFYERLVRVCGNAENVECFKAKDSEFLIIKIDSGLDLCFKPRKNKCVGEFHVADILRSVILFKERGYENILSTMYLEPRGSYTDKDMEKYTESVNAFFDEEDIVFGVFLVMGVIYKEIKVHNRLD